MRERNDPGQYDDLVDEWWRPEGPFAALHWLARARAEALPPARRPDALLVDLACGGGLMAPYVGVQGYRHVGVDLVGSAARSAAEAGVTVLQGDVRWLPLRDGIADVVVAGEVYEHVPGWETAVAETCRVLAPGGTVIADTIARNALARVVVGRVQERLPGGPPPRIHDPALFVPPRELQSVFAAHGVDVRLRGLKVSAPDYLRFLFDRRHPVRLRARGRPLTLYQAVGCKVAGSGGWSGAAADPGDHRRPTTQEARGSRTDRTDRTDRNDPA